MVYKRLFKKHKKDSSIYETLNKQAKFCNLFSILGTPNAEEYCTNLNDYVDEHFLDLLKKHTQPIHFDPNTRQTHAEKLFERWMNTERVRKYFNNKTVFKNVSPIVNERVTSTDKRLISSDSVITALLNRNIQVHYFMGSLGRTANWIGNLMSATKLKWAGQKEFDEAEWE